MMNYELRVRKTFLRAVSVPGTMEPKMTKSGTEARNDTFCHSPCPGRSGRHRSAMSHRTCRALRRHTEQIFDRETDF